MQLHTHAVKTVHSQHLEDMLVTGRHYVFILTSSITGATCLSLGKKGSWGKGGGRREDLLTGKVQSEGGDRRWRREENKTKQQQIIA